MEPTTATIARLLGSLYDAAASPERWPDFLQDLRQTAAADMAYVLAVTPDGQSDLSIQLGFAASAIDDYQRYYVNKDIILSGFLGAKAQHGDWIGDSQSVIPDGQLRRSELFNDFMKANGVAHQCAATLSGLDLGPEAGICMMRSEGAGVFETETIALLTILAPHVKRALNLHRTLQAARMEGALLRQSVETVDLAIIAVNGDGEILNITQTARNILEGRDGLALERKQLRASNAAEQVRLSALIAAAVSTGSGSPQWRTVRCSPTTAPQAARSALWTPAAGGSMLISRRPPKRPLQVVVTPFHSSDVFLGMRPSALIFLADPDAAPTPRCSVLKALYGLSAMECRIADMLGAGKELTAAAELLAMTAQTARFHLKAIFRKTGTNRQVDLVRLILGLPGIA